MKLAKYQESRSDPLNTSDVAVPCEKGGITENCLITLMRLDMECPASLRGSSDILAKSDPGLIEQYCKQCGYYSSKSFHC